mmetsp:Transcript_25362/g.82003  ORF Transcript_25362/g.82003 Transcript_25362/m.82003 type:complete len:219 (+) Transcript_25362:155-811(+)
MIRYMNSCELTVYVQGCQMQIEPRADIDRVHVPCGHRHTSASQSTGDPRRGPMRGHGSRLGAPAGVCRLEVALVDPEVCRQLGSLQDGPGLVLGARVLDVRFRVQHLRPHDGAAGLGGHLEPGLGEEGRLAALAHVGQVDKDGEDPDALLALAVGVNVVVVPLIELAVGSVGGGAGAVLEELGKLGVLVRDARHGRHALRHPPHVLVVEALGRVTPGV